MMIRRRSGLLLTLASGLLVLSGCRRAVVDGVTDGITDGVASAIETLLTSVIDQI